MSTTRALEDREIQQIFSAITGRYAERNRVMLICGIHMALRATELCELRVGDVYDRKHKAVHTYVTVRAETAKRKKARTVRLSDEVGAEIAAFIDWKASRKESVAAKAPLFVSQMGGHLSRKMLFAIVKRILGEACINQSPHCLRKTGATIYYTESECDLIATQQFLGHSDPSTTRGYIGLTSDQIVAYSQRAGSRLLDAISGRKRDTRLEFVQL